MDNISFYHRNRKKQVWKAGAGARRARGFWGGFFVGFWGVVFILMVFSFV